LTSNAVPATAARSRANAGLPASASLPEPQLGALLGLGRRRACADATGEPALDFVGREAFLILVPSTDTTGAVQVGEAVSAAISAIRVASIEQPITASAGLAAVVNTGDAIVSLSGPLSQLGHRDRRIPIFLTTYAVSSEQRTGYDYVVADGILDDQVSYAVGIGQEAFTVLHGRCRCAFAANPHVNPSCSPCWITDVAWLILGRRPIAASIFDDEVTTDVRNVEDGPGWVVKRVYTVGDAMSYG